MNILDKIVAQKHKINAERQKMINIDTLTKSEYFNREVYSLADRLRSGETSGIITEFKRQSPSKGIINAKAQVADVTTQYAAAGAAGLSVLSDSEFFGGTTDDVLAARLANEIPVLRKEFIVDEYQVYETKAMGADVMLLIAECLKKDEVKNLAHLAKSLGLNIIMEVHSEDQLDKYTSDIDIVGVNNRNLKTFEVSIENSKRLFDKMPAEAVRISESGISNIEAIKELKEVGFQGFLIGENFMKTVNPGQAATDFIKSLSPTLS